MIILYSYTGKAPAYHDAYCVTPAIELIILLPDERLKTTLFHIPSSLLTEKDRMSADIHQVILASDPTNEKESDELTAQDTVVDDVQDGPAELQTFVLADHTIGFEALTTREAEALNLCRELWPTLTSRQLAIRTGPRGHNNRIYFLTVHQTPCFASDAIDDDHVIPAGKHILRHPRDKEDSNRQDVTIAKFVETLSIFTARVVWFDASRDNALDCPYMIQSCIPGVQLETLWPLLNTSQRLSITRNLAHVVKEICSTASRSAGYLNNEVYLRADTPRSDDDARQVIGYNWQGDCQLPLQGSSEPSYWHETPKNFVLGGLMHRMKFDPDQEVPWKKLLKSARWLCEYTDVFRGDRYHLKHDSFWPRNIIAEIVSDEEARINGIVDWDRAEFTVPINACYPPHWLWQFQRAAHEWNGRRDDFIKPFAQLAAEHPMPRSEENIGIKRAFDEIMGQDYCWYGYHPAGYDARKLVKAVTHGVAASTGNRIIRRIESLEESPGSLLTY